MYIIRLSDGAWIPIDPDNSDYQKYLKWLAEGNVPLPPDDVAITQADPSALEQAVALLLKLSTPTSPEDVSLKDELINQLEPKGF